MIFMFYLLIIWLNSEEGADVITIVLKVEDGQVSVAATEAQAHCVVAGVLRRGPPTVANRKRKSLKP